jgi:hypothetical protein
VRAYQPAAALAALVTLAACATTPNPLPSPEERVLATTECGFAETGPVADNYRVTMALVSRVTPIGSGSRVDTQLTAYAEDMDSSKGTLSCTTLGALEQRVHALAVKHAAGGLIGNN